MDGRIQKMAKVLIKPLAIYQSFAIWRFEKSRFPTCRAISVGHTYNDLLSRL